MKRLIVLAASLAIGGCATWTPAQKKAAVALTVVVATGLVLDHQNKNSATPFVGPICYLQRDGTCR